MYKYSILWSKCFADLGTGWCVLNLERLDKNFGAQVAHGMGAGKVILCDIAPGRLQTNIVEPKGSKKCVVHFDYHFDNPKKANIEQDAEFSEMVQQEDILICESVQKGLA